jgi:hypothetical protein
LASRKIRTLPGAWRRHPGIADVTIDGAALVTDKGTRAFDVTTTNNGEVTFELHARPKTSDVEAES